MQKDILIMGLNILFFSSAISYLWDDYANPFKFHVTYVMLVYSEIPLLRPPKIKTFYPLKTLFWNFKLVFSSFSTTSVHLIRDHLWDCPKVVFQTTFGQSPRWSYYRNFTVLLYLPETVEETLMGMYRVARFSAICQRGTTFVTSCLLFLKRDLL